MHASCLLFKPKPHVRALEMNTKDLFCLFFFPNVTVLNRQLFSDFRYCLFSWLTERGYGNLAY